MWGGVPHAASARISTDGTAVSTDALAEALQRTAGLHPVELIRATNEGIFAASVGSADVLVHCKACPKTVVVTVRCVEDGVGKRLTEFLEGVFS